MRINSTLVLVWLSVTGEVPGDDKLWMQTYADGGLEALAISPDGERFAVGLSGSDSVLIYGRDGGQILEKLPRDGGHTRAMAFSPDGRTFAFSLLTEDSNNVPCFAVRVAPTAKGKARFDLKGPHADVDRITFGPDSKSLAASQVDGRVFLWDLSGNKLLMESDKPSDTTSLAFTPDGRELGTASRDRSLLRWDIKEPKLLQALTTRTAALACCYTIDGQKLVVGTIAGEIEQWRPGGTKPERVIAMADVKEPVEVLALSPDAVLAASANKNTIIVSSVATGKCLLTLSHSKGYERTRLALSEHGTFLISGATRWLPKLQTEVILWRLGPGPKR